MCTQVTKMAEQKINYCNYRCKTGRICGKKIKDRDGGDCGEGRTYCADHHMQWNIRLKWHTSDYYLKTVNVLKDLAKKKGFEGVSGLSKIQVIRRLEFFDETGIVAPCKKCYHNPFCITQTAINGHIGCLKYFTEKLDFSKSSSVLLYGYAGRNGNIEYIKYLHEHNFPWDDEHYEDYYLDILNPICHQKKLSKEQKECLIYLVENGAPYHSELVEILLILSGIWFESPEVVRQKKKVLDKYFISDISNIITDYFDTKNYDFFNLLYKLQHLH
jgi:hypothetical protein